MDYDMPPLFKALGLENVDESSVELGLCATIIKAHLGKIRSGSMDERSYMILLDLYRELFHYFSGASPRKQENKNVTR